MVVALDSAASSGPHTDTVLNSQDFFCVTENTLAGKPRRVVDDVHGSYARALKDAPGYLLYA